MTHAGQEAHRQGAADPQADCPQETAVGHAVRSGDWSDSLRTHAAECAICGDIVSASQWMQSLAALPEGTVPLPDAGVVWWRAQLAEKQRAAERAQTALAWFEIAAAAICAALAGWIVLDRSVMANLSAWMIAEGWPDFWAAVQSITLVTPAVFSSLAVGLSVAALSVVGLILAQD